MNNKIMIFPIDAKMVIFGLDLNLNKVDTQVIYCNQIKAICGRPTRSITRNSEKIEGSSFKIRKKTQKCILVTSNQHTRFLARIVNGQYTSVCNTGHIWLLPPTSHF